jgi:hypothetical protein
VFPSDVLLPLVKESVVSQARKERLSLLGQQVHGCRQLHQTVSAIHLTCDMHMSLVQLENVLIYSELDIRMKQNLETTIQVGVILPRDGER